MEKLCSKKTPSLGVDYTALYQVRFLCRVYVEIFVKYDLQNRIVQNSCTTLTVLQNRVLIVFRWHSIKKKFHENWGGLLFRKIHNSYYRMYL